MRGSDLLRGAAGLGILAATLEVVTRLGLIDPRHVPPASTILAATAGILADPTFLAGVAGTLAAWALGLGAAVAVGVPLGVLLGASPRTYAASTAVIELLRPIPSVALIPLAILLLGRGLDMRLVLVAYASVWPILVNTLYGVRAIDPLVTDTAHAFGLRRLAMVRHAWLPAAAPFAYTGIRIAAGIALILAISTELIAGGGPGIGTWMLAASQTGVPRELLYAGIVVTGALGVLLNAALAGGERRLFAWHHRVRPS